MRERHRVLIRLGVVDESLLGQLGHDRPLGLGGGHALKALGGLGGDAAVLADDRRLRQPVLAPDLEVVGVVRRGDLQRAGAEVRPDVLVGDDLQLAPHEGQDRLLADEPAVALVLGMDGDGGVGEHRLGPHGGDGDRPRPRRQRVVDVVQRVPDLALLDLQVGDRRAGPWIPVDHVAVAVDVALLVERHEHPKHGPDVVIVQGEALGVVVRRGAQALELLDDRAAVLRAPLPHAVHERLAPELTAAAPLAHERALHLGLGGDPGVVGAEDPLRPLPAHAVIAGQAVLDGVVERVAHVKHAGDVRRRDGDRVVLLRGSLRVRMKQAGLQPFLDDPGLHLGGVIASCRLEVGHRVASVDRTGQYRSFRWICLISSSLR